MAKPVILIDDNNQYSFDVTRIDRTKLYGLRKRIPIDSKGEFCTKASLTLDGSNLLLSGMTAQGYFNIDGYPVSRKDMVGIDQKGNQVEQIPSTLGTPQQLEGPVDESEILDLNVEAFYHLNPLDVNEKLLSNLKSGIIYKFLFNYAAGLAMEIAYLVGNDNGVFALVGKNSPPEWITESAVFSLEEDEDSDLDDLDFESL